LPPGERIDDVGEEHVTEIEARRLAQSYAEA
jgi:hypothetical protein